MLLNNLHPDKDDCLYFLYRFALRSWVLFLSVIFSYPVAEIGGRTLTGKQLLTMVGAFALVMIVDFLSVWIKAYPIYKEQDRIDWENNGRKKTR